MQSLLRASGVPAAVIAEVPAVLQGCDVCWEWDTPGPAAVTTTRLITEFNLEVQMDVWFYRSLIDQPDTQIAILHLIDAAIRWSANGLCKSKEERTLCTVMNEIWIGTHGPPTRLVVDGETGLPGRGASDWAEVQRINLKIKPVGTNAWIAERHQQMFRIAAHAMDTQMKKEGIWAPFAQTLTTLTFSHNALVNTEGATADEALYGRTPPLLPAFEGATEADNNDDMPMPETHARHHSRMRDIAVSKIFRQQPRTGYVEQTGQRQGRLWS